MRSASDSKIIFGHQLFLEVSIASKYAISSINILTQLFASQSETQKKHLHDVHKSIP